MKLQKINKELSEAVLDANKPTRVEPADIKPVDMDYGTQERIAKRDDEIKAKIADDIKPLKDVAEETKGEDKAILGKDIEVKEMLCKDRKEVGKALESLRAKGIKCRVSRAADGENRYRVSYKESLKKPIKESIDTNLSLKYWKSQFTWFLTESSLWYSDLDLPEDTLDVLTDAMAKDIVLSDGGNTVRDTGYTGSAGVGKVWNAIEDFVDTFMKTYQHRGTPTTYLHKSPDYNSEWESLKKPIKESRFEGGRNIDAKDHLPKSLGKDAGKSRKGVAGTYKGYTIHDVGSSFVVTDKNGSTVLQTKWGLPIIYDMIDDMERGSKGPNDMPLSEARHKFEVLWYEGDNAEDALRGDYHSKEFSTEQAAMRFYEKSKGDSDKYGFWVTERDSDWDVVRDIVTESILDRQAEEEHPLDEGKHGHSKRVALASDKSLAEPKEEKHDAMNGDFDDAYECSINAKACSDCDDDDIDSCSKIDEGAAHAMIGDKPVVQEARESNPIQQANDFATVSMDASTMGMLEGDDNI